MTALKPLLLAFGAVAFVAAPLTAQKPTKPDAGKPAKEAPAADTTSPIDEQIASENARHEARLKEIAKEEAAGGKTDPAKFQKAREEEVAAHKQKIADLAAKKSAPKPSDDKTPGKGTDPTDKPGNKPGNKPEKPEKPGKPTDKPGKELPPTGKPTDRPGAEKPTDPTTDKPGKESPPGKPMNDPATGKPGGDGQGKPGEKKVDKQGGGGKGELSDEQKAKLAEAIKNRDQELADLEAKYKADLDAARKKAEADGKPENFAKEEQVLKARYEYQLKIITAKHEGLVKQAGG